MCLKRGGARLKRCEAAWRGTESRWLLLDRQIFDHRGRAVGHRDGAAVNFLVTIEIGQHWRQQPVGLHADLMRDAVIRRVKRPAAHIDTERAPRKRLLKDPLTEIPGKKQAIRASGRQCREKAQLGDPDVLGFVDHDKIDRRFAARDLRGNSTEQASQGERLALGEPLPHPPQQPVLLAAAAGLAADPHDIAIVLSFRELPSVDRWRNWPAGNRGETDALYLSADVPQGCCYHA
jgi:hypothetical protein